MCKGDMIVMKGQRLLGNTKVLDISNNYLSGMLPMWISVGYTTKVPHWLEMGGSWVYKDGQISPLE
jgi:hypothetical protein